MSDKKEFVTLFIHWKQTSADPRQYNQQRVLLEPNYVVAVDLPITKEYIYNIDALENNAPILTPAGMAYVDNQLTSAYRKEPEPVREEEVEWGAVSDDEEDWVDDIDDDEEELDDILEDINWEDD